MNTPNHFIHDLVAEVLPDVETPESWLYWSIMYVISSSAANKYYVTSFKGKHLYYPNLYVMLFGESGLGKAFGITLAKKMLRAADITRLIDGRSSIQAIIKEGSTSLSREGKPIFTDARMAIVNGELSSAIITDPAALTILTDLFDSHDNPDWTNTLKGDGKEKLKFPYVTCLFGSSPSHFYDKIPQANIDGGYIGRNLIIYEDTRSKYIDPFDSEEDEKAKEDMIMNYIIPKYVPHLIEISKRPKTRLILSEPARILMNTWRKEWRLNQHIYNDKTGFINRVPDHVIKVAMCLTLSRFDYTGIIEISDIQEAIEKVTSLVYAAQKTIAGSGIDPTAQQTKKVIDILLAAPENQMTKTDMLVAGYGNFDLIALDRIVDTLLEMKWLRRERVGVGKNIDWLLKLSGEPLESYQRFKKQKEGKK